MLLRERERERERETERETETEKEGAEISYGGRKRTGEEKRGERDGA